MRVGTGLRRALAPASLALLAAACAHTRTEAVLGGTASGSGGLVASVQVRAGSTGAALLGLGVLAAAAAASSDGTVGSRVAQPFPAPVADSPRGLPPLDEARRVHEQDCRRPIADAAANLRCR